MAILELIIMYKVKSFVQYKTNNEFAIVQNKNGIVKIDNLSMLEFLDYLDLHSSLSFISKEKIHKFFDDDTYDDAISFLESNQIIQKQIDYNFNVNKIVFFSNDKMVSKVFSDDVKYSFDKNITFQSDLKQIHLDEQTLLISFFNPVDWDSIDELSSLVNGSNCIWLLSYPYNSSFYFNNLYKKSWHVPCYKCVRAGIVDQERIDMFDEVSYQQIIDTLYNNYPGFLIETKVTFKQANKIFSIIQFIVEQFIKIDTPFNRLKNNKAINILDCLKLDPDSNKVMHETAIHWEMCDCYE